MLLDINFKPKLLLLLIETLLLTFYNILSGNKKDRISISQKVRSILWFRFLIETEKPSEYSRIFEISFILISKKIFNIFLYHKNSTFSMIINLFLLFSILLYSILWYTKLWYTFIKKINMISLVLLLQTYISGITLKNYPDKIKRKEGREIFANS